VQIELDGDLPVSTDLKARRRRTWGDLLRKLSISHALRHHAHLGPRAGPKGTLSPLQLNGAADLDLADFAVLDRSYEKRNKAQRMFEFAKGHIATAVKRHPRSASTCARPRSDVGRLAPLGGGARSSPT